MQNFIAQVIFRNYKFSCNLANIQIQTNKWHVAFPENAYECDYCKTTGCKFKVLLSLLEAIF